MPRLPSPLSKLVLNGTVKHDPKRYANRPADIKPSYPLGYAPSDFPDNLKLIWNQIRAEALPGTLGNSDRQMVAILCKLIAKERADTITTTERGQLIHCLQDLGMTPAHRARVNSISKKEVATSPFATFANPIKTGTNG